MQSASQNDSVFPLVAAARSRLDAVDALLRTITTQRSELDAQISSLNEEASHLRALLTAYGADTPPPTPTFSVVASGKSLADHVADLLAANGRPMHYREIESELRAQGLFSGGGKDPANALLANYFNDARLYRPARGTYAIRTGAATPKSIGTKRRATRRAPRKGTSG